MNWRKKREDDLERELRSHLETEAEEQGDHHAARRAFGNLARVKEDVREAWGWAWLDRWVRDFHYALRTLRRTPVFAATAIASLGLGIGVTTALFSLTDQILLQTLPVKEPRRLVSFSWDGQFIGGSTRGFREAFSHPAFAELRAGNPGVFSGIAACRRVSVDAASGGPAERVMAELVSGNYFEVLGTSASLGRTLTPEDDKVRNAEPYLVLSYGYWQKRFGRDPSVLNRSLDINGHPMTVVGVAAPGFHGFDPVNPPDPFVPLMMKAAMTPTWDDLDRRNSIWLTVFGRLAPGVDARAAQNAIAIPYHNSLRTDLNTIGRSPEFAARYLNNRIVLTEAATGGLTERTSFEKPLYMLLAMAGTLLAIACLNIAILLLSRSAARQKEIAVRLSLGATRSALVRLAMTESFLIALCGGICALFLSAGIIPVLLNFAPDSPLANAIHMAPDWRFGGFTGALILLTALLLGLAPALQSSNSWLGPTLKADSGAFSMGSGQTRTRKILLLSQVALSLLLLAGAGLFARSLYLLLRVPSGIETANLLQFEVDPSMHRYTPERTRQFYLALQAKLESLPGMSGVSGSMLPVLANANSINTIHLEGYEPSGGDRTDMNPQWNWVMPRFFATLGVPLIAGREFTGADVNGHDDVAVVNESFVKRCYPNQSLLGRHIGYGGSGPLDMEIVGVVKDTKGANLKEPARPAVFTPALEFSRPGQLTFYARSSQDWRALAGTVRSAVQALDPSLPVIDPKTVEIQIGQTHFLERLYAFLASAFAGLATLLACVGLYGVTAHGAARRTHEIGVRVALGAAKIDILGLVMREVLGLTIAGVTLGALLALGLGRLVQNQLYGIAASDPLVLTAAAGVMALVSVLAAYLPARRAARMDPMAALRIE